MKDNNNIFPYKQIIPGIMNAISITLIGHPIDTMKTMLQSNVHKNVFDCMKNEGFKGLYRGMSPTLVSHLLKRPIQFPINDYLKDNFGLGRYTAGFIAGGSMSIIGTPLQVIKVNCQVSKTNEYKNAFDFIPKYYQINGLKGFYKGFKITLTKDVLFGGSFLGTYDLIKSNLPNHKGVIFVSGALAHCATWSVLIPVDNIKTKVQKSKTPLAISEAVKTTIKTEGIKGLWKGILPACARTIPVTGFSMIVYEYARDYVK